MFGRRTILGASLALGLAAIAGVGCGDPASGPNASPEGSGSASKGGKKDAGPWMVGAYLSLSGAQTQFGQDTKKGIELALDSINKDGGPKGRPVKVLYEDDKSNPQEVTNKVTQLIDRDKVVAVLGEVSSALSKQGGLVANKKKVPMISPSSTNEDVTEIGPFVFRVCFVDGFQGKMAAEFAVKTLGKKKLGMLVASDDLYSSGLAAEFKKAATALGAEVVLEKTFLKTETNFTTFLNEMKSADPEVIYAPIYYNQMVPMARQAKAVGIEGNKFVGGDGWDSDELLKDAGEEMEGAFFTNHYAPDVPWPNSKIFLDAYKAKNGGAAPNGLAAMGYDAALVLADAMKRSKDDSPQGIRDAIAATKNFQGATGSITINDKRDADKPVVIVQIKGKAYTYHSMVGPGAEAAAPAPTGSADPAASASAGPAPSASAAPDASAAPAASPAKPPPPAPPPAPTAPPPT